MAEQKFPMTADGKIKLENELEKLKTVTRPEIIEKIKIARSFGDLSENSEYESAKNDQAIIEGRIATISNMLQYSEIVNANDADPNEVTIGKKVTFVESGTEEEEAYSIVGSAESNPLEGMISNNSPIAKSIIGKRVGDTVVINTPGGDMEIKITKVEPI